MDQAKVRELAALGDWLGEIAEGAAHIDPQLGSGYVLGAEDAPNLMRAAAALRSLAPPQSCTPTPERTLSAYQIAAYGHPEGMNKARLEWIRGLAKSAKPYPGESGAEAFNAGWTALRSKLLAIEKGE